ncbi:MAG: aminoglycoside phosphotransferase family protein [Victivallaceae bacterium]|nr:aminoglycoside phosphotransferase family protein [Victivallaceae bacterium]
MAFDLEKIHGAFAVDDKFVQALPYGTGHINDTYKMDCAASSYIVQRLNTSIFRRPEALMENFRRVTAHIAEKIAAEKSDRQTLRLVSARADGKPFFRDGEGNFWRCYHFVGGARTYDILETPEQAFQAASAFGQFQCDLADLERLDETIPDFHNTPVRLKNLENAIRADRCGRLGEVAREVDFVMSRAADCRILTDLQSEGKLAERTTHNDTKLNNVLIGETSQRAVCVIDLDTTMPGLPHYDFGDMVRTGTSPAAEDERDLSKVGMRFGMFEALLRGYLSRAKFLNPLEKELLPFSGKLITLEIGIRFLTDYLEGDVYFKTKRPGHNLDRCRTQLKLVESIEAQLDAMKKLNDSIALA